MADPRPPRHRGGGTGGVGVAVPLLFRHPVHLLFGAYSIKQRYYPMRGFGSFASAARFCTGFEEQRQYFRAVTRSGEAVSLADRRRVFQERWATVMTELAVA